MDLFFRIGERLEDRRQRLAVALPKGGLIKRTFEIVRFSEELPLAGSVEEAETLLRTPPG